MPEVKASLIVAVIFASIFTSNIVAAYFLNTDFGNVNLQEVSMASEHGQVEGLLYRPRYASSATPQPAVVLAHGISGAKQFLSGIALELARNGIVALTIDLLGHGGSDGKVADGQEDPTFGTLAAVRYLEARTFVNSSRVGLAGHSLGAGAARAAAVVHGAIRATVLIGGGFGSTVADSSYGTVNSTFPENLLVAIGKYDVLFNLDALRKEVLPPVFGTSEVVSDTIYGSILNGNARKLITPATTHLFEPIDPIVTSEAVQWFVSALEPSGSDGDRQAVASMTYAYRELALLISLIALFALVLSLSPLALSFLHYPVEKMSIQLDTLAMSFADWKVLLIWGGLSLVLFFPMVFVGFAVNIPPVIFGASIAWWALAVAVVGLLVLVLLSKRSKSKPNIGWILLRGFDARGVATAIAMCTLLYSLSILAEAFLALDLGIIAPFFRALTPASRISIFLMLVPFFLVYFTVEGLFLHAFRQSTPIKSGFFDNLSDLARTVGLKVGPYLAILFLQYFPLVLFGSQLFPSFAAFLNEFWWLLTPIFAVSTACSWWFYRVTSRIGTGAVFNALVFSLIAAGLFPF